MTRARGAPTKTCASAKEEAASQAVTCQTFPTPYQPKAANAGLIVMGGYGRNRITEYFLGSNAVAVARSSPVAVLLAR
jgi:nucleotide-binding universal stress UspA family protein